MKSQRRIWPELLRKIKSNGFENVQIFPGIIGKNLPIPGTKEWETYGDPKTYMSIWAYHILSNNEGRRCHEQFPSWGAVGCYLSHLTLWKQLLAGPNDRVLIFEDDIVFRKNFKQNYEKAMAKVPEDADVIFLDLWNLDKSKVPGNDTWWKSKYFMAFHSYIMTRKCAEKVVPILEKNLELQIDIGLSYVSELLEKPLNFYFTNGLTTITFRKSTIQDNGIMCLITPKRIVIVFLLVQLLIFGVYYYFFGRKK